MFDAGNDAIRDSLIKKICPCWLLPRLIYGYSSLILYMWLTDTPIIRAASLTLT